MLVAFRQEAKEEEEDIIGPVTIADCDLLSTPTRTSHLTICHERHHCSKYKSMHALWQRVSRLAVVAQQLHCVARVPDRALRYFITVCCKARLIVVGSRALELDCMSGVTLSQDALSQHQQMDSVRVNVLPDSIRTTNQLEHSWLCCRRLTYLFFCLQSLAGSGAVHAPATRGSFL